MSSEAAFKPAPMREVISVRSVSKAYQIYKDPKQRLAQFALGWGAKMIGLAQRKVYREFHALRDVSFSVRHGEVVGIVGRNGSGKSTLLQLICGTLTPTAGEIAIEGRVAALLELGSGFNPEFTGRENVHLNAAILGLTASEIEHRFDDIVGFADIGEFIDQPVKTYSSGMAVRLAFAVAINVSPDILVVDEALAVGDELFQRKCFARIEQLRKAGTTILFVSHAGGTIIELCDRAILIDAGELVVDGLPKHVVGLYQKLLYAPADARQRIKQEARCELTRHDEVARAVSQAAARSEWDEGEESFNPDLRAMSRLVYESRGATISDVVIKTMGGRVVNSLVRNRRYLYAFKVTFDRDVRDVRFGMQIKTKTGLALGSAMSAATSHEGVGKIGAGQVVSVEFAFNVPINPGTYFTNAGVFGIDGSGEETLLHRVADATAFAILPIHNNRIHEIVDFGCEPRIAFDA